MTAQKPSTVSSHPSGSTGLRRGHLGAGHIAFLVVATVAPLAGVAGASPAVFASNGPAAPATFVIAGALFAIFSVGYVAMSRSMTNAGGYVAYVARGLGATSASAVAYVCILAYGTFQVAMWSQFGVFTHAMMVAHTGLDLPSWVWTLGLLALATFIVSKGVDVSIKVAGTVLALEVLVLLGFTAVGLIRGEAGQAVTTGFNPEVVFGPGLGVAFLFGVAAFVGFEATVVFSEEARDPRRTIPRAVVLAIVIIASLYTVSTLALSAIWGPDHVLAAAVKDPASFLLTPMQSELGGWIAPWVDVLIVTSYLASLVGTMNMVIRLLYAFGRAGILPSRLGTTSAGGTPKRATYAFSGTVLVVFLLFQLAGADPILVTFSWLLALGTVGLQIILVVTSAAIVLYFVRTSSTDGNRTSLLSTLICPLIALAGFVTAAVLAITNYDALLGGGGSNARWLLLSIPVVAAVGAVVAARRATSPDFAADLG